MKTISKSELKQVNGGGFSWYIDCPLIPGLIDAIRRLQSPKSIKRVPPVNQPDPRVAAPTYWP